MLSGLEDHQCERALRSKRFKAAPVPPPLTTSIHLDGEHTSPHNDGRYPLNSHWKKSGHGRQHAIYYITHIDAIYKS